jgi:hypothetical protein
VRVFPNLVFAGEEKQVGVSLHPVAEGKEMAGRVPVHGEPGPDSKIHGNAEEQVDEDRCLYTDTA